MYDLKLTELEKSRKKKSWRISIGFHSILLILAFLLPLMISKPEPQPEIQIVTFNFRDNPSSGSKKAGGSPASREAGRTEANEAQQEIPAEAIPEPEAPAPVTEKIPEKAPPEILTAPNNEIPVPKVPKPEPYPEKVEVPETVPSKVPDVKTPSKKKSPIDIPVPKKAPPKTTTSDSDSDGNRNGEYDSAEDYFENSDYEGGGSGSGQGDADSGSGNGEGTGTGNATGDGNDDSGDGNGFGDGFFDGVGALSRPVISKGDSKGYFVEEGKLVFRLCINREGRVIYVSYDEEYSSITNKEVISKAQDDIMDYKFKKDYSAPKKECGRYTYIFRFADK